MAGPLNLEFRRHAETGQIYVIDGNCRLNGYSYLTTMNGSNYPRAMIDMLSGKDASLSFRMREESEEFRSWLSRNSGGCMGGVTR